MNKIKLLELGLKEFRKRKIKGASISSICWLEANLNGGLVRVEYDVLHQENGYMDYNQVIEFRVYEKGGQA